MMDRPCLGCTTRHQLCHSTCDDYLKAEAANKKRREFLMKATENDVALLTIRSERFKKRRKVTR